MELQGSLAELDRGGALFAVSYDPVDALAAFAARHGITYPLLSDEGSRVIRALGLLDERAEPHRFGIAYPGTFTLDEHGRVAAKHFEQSHRVRPAPASVLERLPAGAGTPAVAAATERDGVRVTAWLGQATYRPWQLLHLHVTLDVAAGLHVHGAPVPDGYTALAVELSGDGVEAGPASLPVPHPFRVMGLDEAFLVHEEWVEAVVPFHVTQLRETLEVGVRVSFQVCSETLCHPPQEIRLTLPLVGRTLVRD